MKSTALIIGTLVAAVVTVGRAPIATAQDPGERVIVAAIQERGYMGVQIAFEDGALVVSGVLPGTPAEEAGLQAGDRILRIGDLATGDQENVEAFLAGTTVGQVLALHVERGDKHANMRIRLVSLAAVQPGAGEQLPPVRRVIIADRPVIVVEQEAESESETEFESETESDAVTDRLQSSRVQAISKLRADARLQTEVRRSEARRAEAAEERDRRIQSTRLRSTARTSSNQEREDAASRRAELRVRASERKVRAEARREAVAARERAEDRAAVAEDRTESKDVARGSAEDRWLEELKRELEGVRAELQRLREEIRKLSRERDDGQR